MNILALDDEKDVKVLYEYFFSDEIASKRINLRVFHNPMVLLDNVEASQEETLLLTDMRMPGMTGTEVVEKLVDRLPKLRVFIISALGVDLDEDQRQRLHIERTYMKPLNFSELKKDIIEML